MNHPLFSSSTHKTVTYGLENDKELFFIFIFNIYHVFFLVNWLKTIFLALFVLQNLSSRFRTLTLNSRDHYTLSE